MSSKLPVRLSARTVSDGHIFRALRVLSALFIRTSLGFLCGFVLLMTGLSGNEAITAIINAEIAASSDDHPTINLNISCKERGSGNFRCRLEDEENTNEH